MIISLGEVRSSVSLEKNGTISARVDQDDAVRPVIYTSPFKSGDEGGYIGIPNSGQTILCCKTSPRDPWYYMSTVYSSPKGSGDGYRIKNIKNEIENVDDRVFKARGIPMRTVWASNAGHKIILSDEYNPDYINKRLELQSGVGKRLKFLDSPEQDCIFLVNEHRDGIKITSEADRTSAAQSVEVESRGPQKYINRESQTDMWVIEGRELNTINRSTGLFKDPLDPAKYGNVNVESAYRDVNIQANSQSSRVFIQTLGPNADIGADTLPDQAQVIQLRTMGNAKSPTEQPTIIVHSNGTIGIHSRGRLVVEAEQNLDLVAGNQININAPNGVNIDAGTGGNVNINGGQAAQLTPDSVQPKINHYLNGSVY